MGLASSRPKPIFNKRTLLQVIQVSAESQVRGAARDAAARLRGHFGALPGGGQATMLE